MFSMLFLRSLAIFTLFISSLWGAENGRHQGLQNPTCALSVFYQLLSKQGEFFSIDNQRQSIRVVFDLSGWPRFKSDIYARSKFYALSNCVRRNTEGATFFMLGRGSTAKAYRVQYADESTNLLKVFPEDGLEFALNDKVALEFLNSFYFERPTFWFPKVEEFNLVGKGKGISAAMLLSDKVKGKSLLEFIFLENVTPYLREFLLKKYVKLYESFKAELSKKLGDKFIVFEESVDHFVIHGKEIRNIPKGRMAIVKEDGSFIELYVKIDNVLVSNRNLSLGLVDPF